LETTNLRKYFSMGILFLLAILSIFIIRPFFISIITALILAYIFYPIYLKIDRSIKKKAISSIITILLIILIIGLPLFFVANTIVNQTHATYLLVKKEILSESSLLSGIEEFSPQTKAIMLNAAEKAATNIINSATAFIVNVPKLCFMPLCRGKNLLNIFLNLFQWGKRTKSTCLPDSKE